MKMPEDIEIEDLPEAVKELATRKLIEDEAELVRYEYIGNNVYDVLFSDDTEYLVFYSYEDAEAYTREQLYEMVEGEPKMFIKDITDYIDEDKLRNDISSDEIDALIDTYKELLEPDFIDDLVRNGIITEEEAEELKEKVKEGEIDIDDLVNEYGYELAEIEVEDRLDEIMNNITHYIDEDVLLNYIDIDAYIDDVINIDRVAHVLASYDGEEIELRDGIVAYRIF